MAASHSGWQMADSEWQMADSEWRIANGESQYAICYRLSAAHAFAAE
ncbi:MAG: hypothetical protein AABZ78_08195 [Chloroflexota bacterium]